jgi:cellulose synthase/poly-beta-1,6-N-acetylglucosamine synthase-like glycosyltransferase
VISWSHLEYWIGFIPLGILGVVRWVTWLIRRIPATFYRPVNNDFRLPMSIVVPVYQEDPVLFARAIESWLANDPVEIVLVIDVTDVACQEVASVYPVSVIVTDVPGKRDALVRGWEACTTPLVALVDSDTVWANDVLEKACMPFLDPRVGGVGTRQNVYNPRGFLQRVNDMYLDLRYFEENAAQTYMGKAVSCLSGRTAVYRREILLQISAGFMNEKFLGMTCMSGDDKRLTCLTMKAGYRTVMQRSARVWSTFPDKPGIFFKQRLRWARNTWRSDLRALSERWLWSHPYLAFTMIDKALSAFTLLAAPTFMTIGLIEHKWSFCIALAIWWWISRALKLSAHLTRRPSSFFLIPPFVLLSFAMAFVKLGALLTIRKQRWLTRQVQVDSDGQVTRTGAVTP